MSQELNQPELIDHPAPRQASSLLGWLLVIAMTAVVYGVQHAPAPASVELDPARFSSPLIKYFGRVGLAMEEWGVGNSTSSSGQQFADQVDEASENAIDDLRAITVIAELEDAEAARARLAELEQYVADEMALRASDAADIETVPATSDEEDGEVPSEGGFTPDPYVYPEMAEDLAALDAIYNDRADLLTPDQIDGLKARHDWYADLALVYGKDDSDPARRDMEASVQTFAMVLFGMLAAALLACIAGFFLFIAAVILGATGVLRMRLRDDLEGRHIASHALIETMGLFLLAFLGVQALSMGVAMSVGIDITIPAMWLTLLVVLWPLARGMRWDDLKAAIGWNTGQNFFVEVGAGIAGYLAGLPVVGVGVALALVLMMLLDGQPSHPVQDALGGGVVQTILLYSLACVWAPVVEETVFRGAFFGGMRARWGQFILPALISSFVFAIIHPQGIVALPALMSLAIVFSGLREWRGSIIAPVIAHALNNAFLVTLMVLIMG